VTLSAVAALAAPARADLIFFANLTGAQENPPVATAASGTGVFVLNDAGTELRFEIRATGLDFGQILPNGLRNTALPGFTPDPNDNVTAAHFHLARPGVNGPVIFGFVGAPIHDQNGDTQVDAANGIIRGRWDLSDSASLPAFLTALQTGNLYANIHTVRFGGGEIRGQILATPEPATVLVLGAMAGGLAVVRRRRTA
jgi:hypothetical protein